MKKTICLFLVFLISFQLIALGAKDNQNWATVENFYKEIQKQLGHELEEHEQIIIDTVFLYYYGVCEQNWTHELWDVAVNKSVEMCRNPIAVAAAKTGIFGEKLLKSLIVTTEDVVSGINNWIESGNEEYQKRHESDTPSSEPLPVI